MTSFHKNKILKWNATIPPESNLQLHNQNEINKRRKIPPSAQSRPPHRPPRSRSLCESFSNRWLMEKPATRFIFLCPLFQQNYHNWTRPRTHIFLVRIDSVPAKMFANLHHHRVELHNEGWKSLREQRRCETLRILFFFYVNKCKWLIKCCV